MTRLHLRRLPLATLHNARELGGYPCAGGGTRWGEYLRTDLLSGLTDADVRALLDYGVRTVVDLRDDSELRAEPNSFAGREGIAYHHISLIPFDPSEGSLNPLAAHPDATLVDLYEHLLESAQSTIARLFSVLANAEAVCLFHCSAGKDRTGLISALLLSLCGVDAHDIISDYQVSNTYLEPRIEKWRAMANEGQERFFLSDAAFMRRTLDTIENRYGGARAYLSHAGVGDADLRALIERFVQRA